MKEKMSQKNSSEEEPSEGSIRVALEQNWAHARHVMNSRLRFTNIHALVIAFIFPHLLRGDIRVILFSIAITFAGTIQIIRQSNALDNYMNKIEILAKKLKLRSEVPGRDYMAIHLDREFPGGLWGTFLRVRLAFCIYYAAMIGLIVHFSLASIVLEIYSYIIPAFVFVPLLTVLFYASKYLRLKEKYRGEKVFRSWLKDGLKLIRN
jgi:hypothetical protein